jgi:hypothetical protein
MNAWECVRHFFTNTFVGQVTFNFLYFAFLWKLTRANERFEADRRHAQRLLEGHNPED